ncbi:vesicular acetylcholine transporter-like [Antedon mediterranea]|uniref:vesicular acetylcholine transporter-like n=1 Tax=Antedon mediterranea TaxID=105859 RepID=UPI003AF7B9E2
MDRIVLVEGRARVYTRLISIFIAMIVDALSSTTIKTITPYMVTFTDCPNTTCPEVIGSVPEIQVYGLSFIFAGSEAMHILTLPFAGFVCESFGFDLPLILGLLGQICASLCFAFSTSQLVYIIARVFLGASSAFIGTVGMRYIAESTNSPKMRDTLFGITYCLYGFSCLGPTYSGVLYYFYNMIYVFIPLAVVCFLCIIVLVAVTRVQTNVSESAMTWYRHADESISCGEILLDPYVVLAALGIGLSQLPEACLAPGIALWISEEYGWPIWRVGVAFVPSFVTYQLSMVICMFTTTSASRYAYLVTIAGFLIGAFGNVFLSADGGYQYVVVGIMLMAFSLTASKFCLVAILASIGRTRFSSSPGRIFSVFKLSTLVPFAFGPIFALPINKSIGFPNMCIITASTVVVFSPLILIFRSLSSSSEKTRLIEDTSKSNSDSDEVSYGTPKDATESEGNND